MSMHENGQMNELLNQELFRSMARVKLNLWDISSRLLFANYSFASFLYPHYLHSSLGVSCLKESLGSSSSEAAVRQRNVTLPNSILLVQQKSLHAVD